MFSFDPINRQQYRVVVFVTTVCSIVLIAFFPKILDFALSGIRCRDWGSLCALMVNNLPEYFDVIIKIIFVVVIAVATLRRTSLTRISGYWAIFLPSLAFLSLNYLTELGLLQSNNLRAELANNPTPWFMLAAISLALLLSFAPDRSRYFQRGYWTADPPLGYVLSLSSYWLLVTATPGALNLLTETFNNYSLTIAANNVQNLLVEYIPLEFLSPVVPSVAFSTSALLLIILGRMNNASSAFERNTPASRLQNAVHTTRAAQSLNGLKL